VVSSHEAYVEAIRPMLRAVTGASILVLLVACGNVAGLLLVRATRRQKELAIRAALGASRGAMTRLLFAEAVLLGAGALIVGLAGAWVMLPRLSGVVQQQIGRSAPEGAAAFAIDPGVTVLAAGLALLTVLLCTAVPLLHAARPQVLDALAQGAGRTATEGRQSRRIRSVLIALEIAVSLTLLTASTLMLRTTIRLLNVDLGFDARGVVMGSITLRQNRYPDASARAAVLERMTTRLAAMPGMESVGLTTAWPAQQGQAQALEARDGSAPSQARAAVHGVSAGYFDTLRIPLRAGRPFDQRDRLGSQPVAIVSQALARGLWPDGEAVGRRVTIPQQSDGGDPVAVERLVVAVAADVRQDPSDTELADAYVPLPQAPGRFAFALMRIPSLPGGEMSSLRAAFRDVDPEMALNRPGPLQDRVDALVARPRFLAALLTAFAAIAALLALVGVYGVIAYAVRQREREIAVRMALGADRSRLVRLFVREGAAILAAGLALGLLAATLAGRLLESQLFGTPPRDPIALGGAAAAFAVAGLVAIWWPSRRAASTDPAVALRAE
jgi:putative ABC transport system permease protein